MTASDYLILYAELVVRQVPVLVVTLMGLWYALTRKQVLGCVSSWAAWGFGLLLANALAGGVVQVALIGVRAAASREFGPADPDAAVRLSLWSLASYPLFIGGIAALGRAVFVNRNMDLNERKDEEAVTGAA